MNLYFDTQADQPCMSGVAPYQIAVLHLIYTNPTPDALWAFRAGVELQGLGMVLSAISSCDPLIVDEFIQEYKTC